MKRKLIDNFTDFGKGFITGFIFASVIFGFVFALMYVSNKNKEMIKNVERQIEIQELREDYLNRDTVEFLDDFPDVRRAADVAASEFERKRDEAVFRFRNRLAD
jgi:hypothetical protein